MDEEKFIDILVENRPEEMMTFLLEHGKKRKPICPIYFEDMKLDSRYKETQNG